MRIYSDSFQDGQSIPERCAMGKYDPKSHATFADNLSPHLAWESLPAGTKSLVLICTDSDAPTKPDDVNKEGRTVPAELPRAGFDHWVLVDLNPNSGALKEGEFSRGVSSKGKPGPDSQRGTRSGLNDYTSWFKGDSAMEGQYYGYDGPFPPWNDSIAHRYFFTLYALDVERCPVSGTFTSKDVQKAIEGHVLGQATIWGSYKINPDGVLPR